MNHRRVYRLYRKEDLNLRGKQPRRHVTGTRREAREEPKNLNDIWSMDFVSDSLFDGRRFRALTLVDNLGRECLTIHADQSIKGTGVVVLLDELAEDRGVPNAIRVDNGPEFISKALDLWAYENGVTLDFSRPGKPTDNAYIESFNGSFGDECLNVNWFLTLEDAREKIESWRVEGNEFRPHYALGDQTPSEFARARHRGEPDSTGQLAFI